MKATNVKVTIYEKGTMLAFADVEFDNAMWVKGFKLFKGKEGRDFDIGFPSEPKKERDGTVKYWNFVNFNLKDENIEAGRTTLEQVKNFIVDKYKETKNTKPNYTKQPNTSSWPNNNDDDVPF
jgi:DNA-binding cell septation regulator SpoVG